MFTADCARLRSIMTRKAFIPVSEPFMQAAGHEEAMIFSKLLYVQSIAGTANIDQNGYCCMTLSTLEQCISATPMQVRFGLIDLDNHGMIKVRLPDCGDSFRFKITATPDMMQGIVDNTVSFWEGLMDKNTVADKAEVPACDIPSGESRENISVADGFVPAKEGERDMSKVYFGFPKKISPEAEEALRKQIKESESRRLPKIPQADAQTLPPERQNIPAFIVPQKK